MRQRKAKDLDKRLAYCSEYLVKNLGRTDSPMKKSEGICEGIGDTYVEIGSGKGQFIIKRALNNPSGNYIGIEGQETVILRAAEKAMAVSGKAPWPENVAGREQLIGLTPVNPQASLEPRQEAVFLQKTSLNNLKFACCYVESMKDFFGENQLSGVYLNFSDPWPKKRHAKRRLTHHIRLMDYVRAIRDGGFIEFKTDNDPLFEFSVEEFRLCESNLQIVELTRNLHGADCTYDSACFTTEYEDKFSGRGKNINYIKATVIKQK